MLTLELLHLAAWEGSDRHLAEIILLDVRAKFGLDGLLLARLLNSLESNC